MGLERVAEAEGLVNGVDVAPSNPLVADGAGLFQFLYDALGSSFGDPDYFGDIAKPNFGVAIQADEDVGVVGKEGPTRALSFHKSKFSRWRFRKSTWKRGFDVLLCRFFAIYWINGGDDAFLART
jgi:hypothetical protein